MEIKGKVAHYKKDKSEKYKSGISFAENHAKNIYFVKRLIRAYYYNKEKYCKSSASDRKTAIM
jgi:hypothetical protein